MSYFNVIKEIERGNIANVYLLLGMESFFIQNIVQKLINDVLAGERDNLTTYDLTEVPIQQVVQDATTFPFFGERKVIVANNASFLQSRPKKLPFTHNIESLEQYLRQPSPSTVFVLIAPYESIDGREKMTRQLKKEARFVECMPINKRDLHKWILTFTKHANIQIERDAVELLAANLSTNLYLVQNELNKCAQYVGEGNIITKDVVLKLLAHLPINTALELADVVIHRDLAKAMFIYRDLKLTGEEPIGLIALLAFQFRIILQVKLLKQKGYTEYQMRQKINAHPYVIKIAYERERRFTFELLKKIISHLTEADAKIKRGEMNADLAFEQLLYSLMNIAS